MNTLRRFDWVAQLVIFIASMVVACFSIIHGLLGEALLGAWQLLSALLNTYAMYRSPFRQRIIIYWVVAIVALLVLLMWTYPYFVISTVASIGIAVYYWITYKSFIEHLEHRKEISGVIHK